MRKMTYKTNIKCEGCKAQVAPALNEIHGIIKWEVDLISKDKILIIHAEDLLNESIVVSAVEDAGFKIEILEIESLQSVYNHSRGNHFV